ncbi:hypothetical protein [Nocardia fluminea]|uniref:hypothetical protein n=1 Tax=Nocardia fluminea TaxID=134984 RepID=UPI0033F872E6
MPSDSRLIHQTPRDVPPPARARVQVTTEQQLRERIADLERQVAVLLTNRAQVRDALRVLAGVIA